MKLIETDGLILTGDIAYQGQKFITHYNKLDKELSNKTYKELSNKLDEEWVNDQEEDNMLDRLNKSFLENNQN